VCSTPVGIEEAGMAANLGALIGPMLVLNARGHRRGGHSSIFTSTVKIAMCSTPVGIEEAGMIWKSPWTCKSPPGAQRPWASKRRAYRGPLLICSAKKPVLNARGHRRGGHNGFQ